MQSMANFFDVNTKLSLREIARSGLEIIIFFSCSNQLDMKFVLFVNLKLLTSANSLLLNLTENYLLIHYENRPIQIYC